MNKLEILVALDNWFRAEDGYLEKGSTNSKYLYTKTQNAGKGNFTKYWDIIYKATGKNYQGGAWCMGSLTAALIEVLGVDAAKTLQGKVFPAINCQATYDYFKPLGRTYSTPEEGDYVVFWNGSRFHHVEYVLRVSGDTFYTFGGNTSSDSQVVIDNGGAARYGKVYSVKACKRAGHKFIRLDYDSVATTPTNTKVCSGTLRTTAALNCRAQAPNGTVLSTYQDGAEVKVTHYVYVGSGNAGAYWFKTDRGWISGNYLRGWVRNETTDPHNMWWYMTGSGGYYRDGIKTIDGHEYLFKPDGYALQDDWYALYHGGIEEWFFAYDNCQLARGNWATIGGSDYYFKDDCVMAADAYIKSKSKPNVWYYVGIDGKWDNREYTENQIDKGKVIK